MGNIVSGGPLVNGTDNADVIIVTSASGATNDTVNAGGGNDVVIADHDAVFQDSVAGSNNTTANAFNIDDTGYWSTKANPDVTDTSTPYTTVMGTGAGAPDYFAVTVAAGQTITLDIDYGYNGVLGFDPVLALYGSDGTTLLTLNDDGNDGGLGSSSVRDSFLTYTATTAGIYYIRVGDYTGFGQPGGAIPQGATYMLNVSVGGHANTNVADFDDDTVNGDAGNDLLYGVGGNDHLNGGLGDDVLAGGIGDDIMDGGDGIDTVSYVTADSGVSLSLGSTLQQTTFGDGKDMVLNIENIEGSAHRDFFFGSVGNNLIRGNDGDDDIDGNDGDDLLLGGDGEDTVKYVTATAGVVVDLSITGAQNTLGAGIDTLESFENLTGSDFADKLTGNAGDNEINGGEGADKMIGGAGNDFYSVDRADDQVIEVDGEGIDRIGANFSYSLAGLFVEELFLYGTGDINGRGNGLDNQIWGNSGNNRLNGADGADTMRGGLGNDRYVVDNVGDQVIENAGQGLDAVETSINYSLVGLEIENLRLAGNDAINAQGNNMANVIAGNANNNQIDGAGGDDEMSGGAGDDTYYVDSGADKVIEKDGEGSDTVFSSVTFSLAGQYTEVLNLTGNAAINGTGNGIANRIVGNGAANTLSGGAGNDKLDGGGGADKLIGGLGNDTFVVDDAADVIQENSGEGNDTVESSISYSLAGQFIETLVLTGNADIDGTGNGQANTLIGNDGENTLDGKGGADSLRGGLGNDTLIVDNVNDKIVELDGEGYDTVLSSVTFSLAGQFAEKLELTGNANINGTGNGLNNYMVGNSAANTLSGGGGSDDLNGGLGADTLLGGAGMDDFWFRTALGGGNVDKLNDFSHADDGIVLDKLIFTEVNSGTLAASAFREGTVALDADDRIVYNKATGDIFYDADGSGAGAAILFAKVAANSALGADDFYGFAI